MSDLIRRESLKQRINLNYNSHQYIDTQSIKDIINTEPSVEDKTVEELNKIKADAEEICKEAKACAEAEQQGHPCCQDNKCETPQK